MLCNVMYVCYVMLCMYICCQARVWLKTGGGGVRRGGGGARQGAKISKIGAQI